MSYVHLLQHRRKRLTRSIRSKYRWIAVLGLGLAGVYVAFVLGAAGFVLTEMLRQMHIEAEPVAYVNAHLLGATVVLFLVRFFLQKSPGMRMQAYLPLPIPTGRLVGSFQLDALLSLHNLFPFFFLVPFWVRHFLMAGRAEAGVPWLLGAALLVVISHFGVVLVRAQMGGTSRGFVIGVATVAALSLLDQIAGTTLVNQVSSTLFDGMANGRWSVPLVLVAVAGFLFGLSTDVLRRRLRANDVPEGGLASRLMPFVPERGPVWNLMLLELKLMWRNKRPRVFLSSTVILGALYVGIMLFHADRFTDPFSRAVIGVFASGMFVLNYGQLMFSWESSYFDGFLARSHRPHDLVRAKLLVLQCSAVVFFLLSLPLFIILAPQLLPFHVAFLFYNAGITSVLVILLAISNQKRVDLGRSGVLLNYEGFSLAHFLWFVPTLIPPALLLYGTVAMPKLGLLLIGGMGLAGLAGCRWWYRVFAHQLVRRKYVMASGFRGYDR